MRHGLTAGGVAYCIIIFAEIDRVQFRTESWRPTEGEACRVHERALVGGNGVVCLLLWRSRSCKAPYIAFGCSGAIKLIDSPVIRFLGFKRIGIVGCHPLGDTADGIGYRIEIITKVDGVQFCIESRSPTELGINGYVLGTIGWIRVVSLLGRSRKVPDRAFPWTVRIRLIDFINPPEIVRIQFQKPRIESCVIRFGQFHQH